MVDYKNYKVWQKAHSLVLKIYTTTNSYPDSEKYIEETEADILLPEIVEIKKM